MNDVQDCLIEIGTEELPPNLLKSLSERWEQGLCQQLQQAQLSYEHTQLFATPRRFALVITGLSRRQPPQHQSKKGPLMTLAYRDGDPTPAGLGFARSCGVPIEALTTHTTDKGDCLWWQTELPGKNTVDLLPTLVEHSLTALSFARPMRWGSGDLTFIRPIHWILIQLAEIPLETEILGIRTSTHSRGHRFHAPEPLRIPTPTAYEQTLMSAQVMANFARRQHHIEKMVQKLAAAHSAQAVIEPCLLTEVTAIVEWPVPLLANFEPSFLTVPPEALMSAMQSHQKCFPLIDGQRQLLPHFITVANLDSRDPEQVIAGNERVMRARLTDAAFFYQQDLHHTNASRLAQLERVLFQHGLGSMAEKSERIAHLSQFIASSLTLNTSLAEQAGRYCKTDLVSSMVGEFPELQGIMGSYYAQQEGAAAEVVIAIKTHYQPRFAGDDCPTGLGAAVAIADKLDTLVGNFALGHQPKGDKDPFALRRAALGIVRTVIEQGHRLSLSRLYDFSRSLYPASLAIVEFEPLYRFLLERFKSWALDQGARTDEFAAVTQTPGDDLTDIWLRLQAIQRFRVHPAAEALAAAHKRVNNLLSQQETISTHWQTEHLELPAERELATALTQTQNALAPLLQQGAYEAALNLLSELHQPVDDFFETVMVLVENPTLRRNRLALLGVLRHLFTEIADFSCLQVQEPSV